MAVTGNKLPVVMRLRTVCAASALLCALYGPSWAETPDPTAEYQKSRSEYEEVARAITLSEERLGALAAEIATVRRDHAAITAALIQAAKTEKKLAEDIEDIGARLEALRDQEDAVRGSLSARRGLLAEVLGALQRMGMNPPPALLVKPEDALGSVRSSILLGAVVPELREQTEELLADLRELQRIAASIDAERERLTAVVREQLAEKQRLAMLLEMKRKLQGEAEAALATEQARAEELAARAGSLKELIAGLEAEAEKRLKAEAAMREAERARELAEAERHRRDAALAALPVPEANRLTSTPFSALARQLSLPVAGSLKRRFGGNDGNGGVMQGDTVATQSGAIVTAPADGNVLFAGPFRSYGQLLILNAGDGYHIVLAGMSRISVALGQRVLAGEPVGAMGEARLASASALSGRPSGSELYVEFRKDGKPVDPAPWWARTSGRTGNGT